MKTIAKSVVIASALMLAAPAFAQSERGATGGALVGGPVGAVVGAIQRWLIDASGRNPRPTPPATIPEPATPGPQGPDV